MARWLLALRSRRRRGEASLLHESDAWRSRLRADLIGGSQLHLYGHRDHAWRTPTADLGARYSLYRHTDDG